MTGENTCEHSVCQRFGHIHQKKKIINRRKIYFFKLVRIIICMCKGGSELTRTIRSYKLKRHCEFKRIHCVVCLVDFSLSLDVMHIG